MLSRFDDYPIHQTPEPIAHAATERPQRLRPLLVQRLRRTTASSTSASALAIYPNLGIMDCGFSIVRDGEQHAFHASRRAPQEPIDTRVGPFRIEILEPMKSVRVTLDDNETGIACDLTFDRAHGLRRRGPPDACGAAARLMMDATRFAQFGRWQGEIRYARRAPAASIPRASYGTKDRSLGGPPGRRPGSGRRAGDRAAAASSSCGRRSTGAIAAPTSASSRIRARRTSGTRTA